jgi:DNA anti-recombination protein RmuC
MPSHSQPHPEEDSELEAAVDQAIAACDGDRRSAIRALIVANNYLESEVSELMKAISHAYTRGRFQSYSG